MADILESIYSYLSTYAGLTALISTRVYPDDLPEDVIYPAITFRNSNTDRYHAFVQDTGLVKSTIDFECHAVSRSTAKAVAKQLRLALQNQSGVTGGVGGVNIKAVLIQDEYDDEEPGEEPTPMVYITYMNFEITHEE